MINTDALSQCELFFKSYRRIAISSHARPDGDALGAALALRRILTENGWHADVLGLEPFPHNYSFLPADHEIRPFPEGWLQEYDAFAVLDCGAFDRLPDAGVLAAGKLPVCNIDHHRTNDGFGDSNLVDPVASSTGELIWRLAQHAGWTVSLSAAEALWVAIVTDTGRFSFENTSPETLRVAAQLMEQGVVPAHLDRYLYRSISQKEMALSRSAMESLEYYEDGCVASVTLTRKDFAELECGPQEAQNIIELPRSIEGVQIALFFYELPDGASVKVSTRCYAPYDVSELCRGFGGGGHNRAAACAVNGSVEDVKQQVLSRIHAMWFAQGTA